MSTCLPPTLYRGRGWQRRQKDSLEVAFSRLSILKDESHTIRRDVTIHEWDGLIYSQLSSIIPRTSTRFALSLLLPVASMSLDPP